MADLSTLTGKVELEKIKIVAITHVPSAVILVTLVGHVQLYFFLALFGFEVLLLKVNFLVKNLISESDDTPPEDIVGHLVKLFGEFVEYC